MELAKEKIDLIEKIIKSDRKFANNEDLYDDFETVIKYLELENIVKLRKILK